MKVDSEAAIDSRFSFSQVEQALIFLFIALCPIQDWFLAGTPLRYIGGSPSLFPLVGIVLISVVRGVIHKGFRVSRIALCCVSYIFLTTIYGLYTYGFYSYGHNLIIKSLVSSIPIGLFLFAIFGVNYNHQALLRKAIYTAFAIYILGYLFGNSNPLGFPTLVENPILHTTFNPNVRPRGLCSESSLFAISGICIGLLCAHLARTRLSKALFVCTTVVVLAGSGSKGGILTLIFYGPIYAFLRWRSKWYQRLAVLSLVIPIVSLLLWKILPILLSEEEGAVAGTFATRFSMMVCAIVVVAHHPFGVGLSGFLPAIAQFAPTAMSFFDGLFGIPVLFGELRSYLVSGENLDTKTFFFDQLIRFGLPFVVLYGVMLRAVVKRLVEHREISLLVAALSVVLATTTFVPIGSYFGPIVLGVAYSTAKRTNATTDLAARPVR